MKGSHKLFAILVFAVLCIGLVPMIVRPLPYEGLDWLSYEASIQYGDYRHYLPIIFRDHAPPG